VNSITYSDGTPAVTTTYDRMGKIASIVDAAGTRSFSYDTVSSQLNAESYSGGVMSGVGITRTYDALHRASAVNSSLNTTTPLTSATYSYDNASRLQSVTNGTNSVSYAYATNSSLV
jgi:uncharacterized protein RhaS with RHS repeats